jgi:hypothetical protein
MSYPEITLKFLSLEEEETSIFSPSAHMVVVGKISWLINAEKCCKCYKCFNAVLINDSHLQHSLVVK